MSAPARKKPDETAPGPEAERRSGVEIIAREPEPGDEETLNDEDEEPESLEPCLQAIVAPEGQSIADRAEFTRWLEDEWGWLIDDRLNRRTNIVDESKKDLRQRILIILVGKYAGARDDPEKMRGHIAGVVRRVCRNHTQRKKLPIDRDADPDAERISGKDPERAAMLTEDREWLALHLSRLRPVEAEAFVAIEFQKLTFEEAAEQLGRPASTIDSQHARAWEKLEAMAAASRREEALAARRKKAR